MSTPTYENVHRRSSMDVHREIIRNLAGRVRVDVIANDLNERREFKQDLEEHGVPSQHVRFHDIEHGDIWMRDMGPFFVRSSDGDELKIVDWQFNYWGYASVSEEAAAIGEIEAEVDTLIAAKTNRGVITSTMTMEGGALEFNGRGTLIVTEPVVFQRNPQYQGSRELAEAEFKRVLNVQKVIWIPWGLIADTHTINGRLAPPPHPFTALVPGFHTDEHLRFVDERTVLLAWVSEEEAARDPFAAIDRERMEENFRILASETDQDGNPLRIIRMPMPDTILYEIRPGDGAYDFMATINYLDGTVFPVGEPVQVIEPNSYLNFLVTNGVVIGQKFWKPGRAETLQQKDEEARQILQQVFPDREVVLLDAENVNLGGGGIHCITQQQPATRR